MYLLDIISHSTLHVEVDTGVEDACTYSTAHMSSVQSDVDTLGLRSSCDIPLGIRSSIFISRLNSPFYHRAVICTKGLGAKLRFSLLLKQP